MMDAEQHCNRASMPRSRRRKARASAPKGTARRTLSAARFFFDQAGRREHHDIEHYEYYVEAAIVFARMVLEHLQKEFGEKRGSHRWIKNLEDNPLIKDLKRKRNSLTHERPIGVTPSRKDVAYIDEPSPETSEAHEMLADQLDEIETVVNECEKLFK
jgi:hypothetical protein